MPSYTPSVLSRLRKLWRAARSTPVLRLGVEALDRLWWARVILRADVVDLDFVAAQRGRRISARAAVRRYVRGGFRQGFALNPLFMERTVSRQLSDAERVPALYAYLVNDRAELVTSPNWDAPRLAAEEPAALADLAGPLGFAWRRAHRDGWIAMGGGTTTTRLAWPDLLAAAIAPIPAAPAPEPAVPAFVCVLGPDETDPDQALGLAAAAGELGLDVDVIVTGRSFDEAAQASILAAWSPRVAVRRAPLHVATVPRPTVRDAATTFRGPGAALSPEAFRDLVRAGATGPTAALWLAPDGTIASAGTVFSGGRAGPLLAGHPVEDARRLGARIPVPALAGPARSWPAGTTPDGPGHTLTTVTVTSAASAAPPAAPDAPDTDVDTLLGPSGLELDRWVAGVPRLRRTAVAGERPQRWAIKTAAPAGRAGESWGETHFARGLAAALERLGEQCVIDGRDATDRPSASLDDVVLVLRGPHRIVPPPTGCRILWIISHPDEITADELDDFDVVFAASAPWARTASGRFGREIEPLLQCTDVRRFHPSGAVRTEEIVFVGTARGIARPVVVEPLRAGIPVRVYGPDWRGYIPASAIAADGIANDRLPGLYERAAVVLNDHWPAMRREGFVSNRLFDVVAAGGRAISDDVAGIEEIFGEAVRTFTDTDELISMLQGDLVALFGPADEMVARGDRIRQEHSFDARAHTLIAAVRRRAAQSVVGGPP